MQRDAKREVLAKANKAYMEDKQIKKKKNLSYSGSTIDYNCPSNESPTATPLYLKIAGF